MFYNPINNSINVVGVFKRDHEATNFSIADGFQTPCNIRSTSNVSSCDKKENASNLLMSCGKRQMYKLEAKFYFTIVEYTDRERIEQCHSITEYQKDTKDAELLFTKTIYRELNNVIPSQVCFGLFFFYSKVIWQKNSNFFILFKNIYLI